MIPQKNVLIPKLGNGWGFEQNSLKIQGGEAVVNQVTKYPHLFTATPQIYNKLNFLNDQIPDPVAHVCYQIPTPFPIIKKYQLTSLNPKHSMIFRAKSRS